MVRAKELTLLNDHIGAEEARGMGLVNWVMGNPRSRSRVEGEASGALLRAARQQLSLVAATLYAPTAAAVPRRGHAPKRAQREVLRVRAALVDLDNDSWLDIVSVRLRADNSRGSPGPGSMFDSPIPGDDHHDATHSPLGKRLRERPSAPPGAISFPVGGLSLGLPGDRNDCAR